MLYHVSPTPGLRLLTPRVSSHKKAYVYAIDDLVTGLLFGVRHDDLDFMLWQEDGKPVVTECYPGAFAAVYQGKSCTMYQVEEEGFQRGITGWKPELVCETTVPVLRETAVEDLYQRLIEEATKGNLILRFYEDTPEYRAAVSDHIVDRLIRFDLLDSQDPRVRKYFGRIVEELKRIMDGHLL